MVDPFALALICQRAENGFVGVQSGLMDQFAESCGVAGAALLLDCRSHAWRPIPLPADLVLVVCHTGSPRHLDGSAYNLRRSQCEAAVAELARDRPGHPKPARRDARGPRGGPRPPGPGRVPARRARRRPRTPGSRPTVDALAAGDLAAVGRLFAESHASLRDRFEVSSPELDAMVEIASSVPGVIAARMTGAGFGGCTVNLVRPDAVDALRDAVMTEYPSRTGLTPRVLPSRPWTGRAG